MANKKIVWEVLIGSIWVDVQEKVFIHIMHMDCEKVSLIGGKKRIAVFFDKKGVPIGKMYVKEDVK